MEWLSYAEQFYLEDKGRTSGNAWLRQLAVAPLCGNVDFPFITHTHLLHGDDPAFAEVAEANGQGGTAAAGVELFAGDGAARLTRGDDAAGRGMFAVGLALGQHLIIYAIRKRHHAFLLRFIGEPILVGLCIRSFIHAVGVVDV